MPSSFSLAEFMQQVTLLEPATDAAGRTSAKAVSLKNAHKVFLVYLINQGNAATVLLTPQQASTVTKTGAKALANNVKIYANLDEATSSILVRQTDGVSFTTDAATKIKRVIFEIDPSGMDVAGGFDCLLAVTGASNVANVTAAEVYVAPARYGAGPDLLVN
jgi:hypothetical protein